MKNGVNYYEEYKTIQQVKKLLNNVYELVSYLPERLQSELIKYHNEDATLIYCTRWGVQAAEEILEDWSKITAPLGKK